MKLLSNKRGVSAGQKISVRAARMYPRSLLCGDSSMLLRAKLRAAGWPARWRISTTSNKGIGMYQHNQRASKRGTVA